MERIRTQDPVDELASDDNSSTLRDHNIDAFATAGEFVGQDFSTQKAAFATDIARRLACARSGNTNRYWILAASDGVSNAKGHFDRWSGAANRGWLAARCRCHVTATCRSSGRGESDEQCGHHGKNSYCLHVSSFKLGGRDASYTSLGVIRKVLLTITVCASYQAGWYKNREGLLESWLRPSDSMISAGTNVHIRLGLRG